MRIGLYFGSFNPIHIGHLIIAEYVVDHTDVNQVWLVVSPQNPLKPSATLLNENHRLHLARLATENNPRLRVSNIEFKLPRPSFTINTLSYLKEKFPQHEFYIIVGSDSFQNIYKWKNYELLLSENNFIVYQRPGFDINIIDNVKAPMILEAPLLNISATYIRNLIKSRKSIKYLVPDIVAEEIESQGYYRKLKQPPKQ